jgi:hypothetical protein
MKRIFGRLASAACNAASGASRRAERSVRVLFMAASKV